MKKQGIIGLIPACAALVLIASSPAAAISVRASQTQSPGEVSNDVPAGAYLTGSIVWDNRNNYHSTLVVHDKLADGKAPILRIFYTTTAIGGRVDWGTVKCSAGNGGSCTYTPTQFNGSGIYSLRIDVCNGGTTSSPQWCNFTQWLNPYYK